MKINNDFEIPIYNNTDVYYYLFKLCSEYSKYLFTKHRGKIVDNKLKLSLQVDINQINNYINNNKFYWNKDFLIYKFDYNFKLSFYIPNKNEYDKNINKRSCLIFEG
jgi:hypothetical protein